MDKGERADDHAAEMALTVVVRSGEDEPSPTITFDAPRIVIGRGDGCDVRLPDATISHRHATLRQRGSDYIILDEGSSNGTFVGAVRLPAHTARIVRSGDLVRVGRVWLELRLEPAPPTAQPKMATKALALSLVAGALRAEGQPAQLRVVVKAGPDAGKSLEIDDFDQPHLVGRGPQVAMNLDEPNTSRRHAELIRRGGQLFVRDLGSRNGTRIGELRLEPDREYGWKPTVPLFIGEDVIVYEDQIADTLSELEGAADEHMRDDESIDPPPVARGLATAGVGLPSVSRRSGTMRQSTPYAATSTFPQPSGAGAAQAAGAVPLDPRRTPCAQPHFDPLAAASGTAAATAPGQRSAYQKRTPRARPRRAGWNPADYFIALLAMVIVAFSGIGMVWLFHSQ